MAAAGPKESLEAIFIAIDFGTTKSGYSFAFGRDGAVNTPVTTEGHPCKDDTVIILNRADNSFHAFGKLALEEYENMDDDEKERVSVFRRFKMELFNDPVRTITTSSQLS